MRPLDASDVGQLRVWASGYGTTAVEQVKVIRDLLVHANEDRMPERDRQFCRAALLLLTDGARA